MPDATPQPAFAAIVVAAGTGERAPGAVPKQFRSWKGRPVLLHSLDALLEAGAAHVVVAHPADRRNETEALVGARARVSLVAGAATRQGSVAAGLSALPADAPGIVLIHDAARPDLPIAVIKRLLAALDMADGAIPVLPVTDSLVRVPPGAAPRAIDRRDMMRVQTPQAFRLDAIRTAHWGWTGSLTATDDAQVLSAAGFRLTTVAGDERLAKLTYNADFGSDQLPVRIGAGYDVHRLEAGKDLWLCGVQIESPVGLAGHSDADVALHALTDALLGAIGAGDIGTHFPPSDMRWQGASSDLFLRHADALVAEAGYGIGNVDLTIICESPRIGPHRDRMRSRLAEILRLAPDVVSIKATTTEKLGFTGRAEGIAAQASVCLVRAAGA
ncbi:bifunctional 2-C-methyl-D-erythritol 4-phosphate cytidylyltransferase/2-C-methyl-D-erythritol 2,4-cyclodiphosphate synthase [Erythrobacteraceae bacterium CFH 75059]|uniref:bifunctional 2-C-methyl-D-erythritol 4-phosphate cytidylyltransferase/2-C-methyl-D-erythritol 2,4-cyclodiphosphate synthase n=1 Tax=Qipengyuania thermophila TaxID=2509361 RepID=UPI00101FB650|nr:bifunctional 2-C-methyl-D-erythritol 4-phosphate cytidylyltransferase/2-C-methyl-D-erythritol 2,4-cyclodiphosphate synthase [Qipengyuania thermophila]TCD05212.1 bifunctional 2-C-methyl-D-erythritol 4-phosphate cytidylyltransferase/2-C-methyl-D-erythritol 2,4-cyclodiphosphate synthase [Erythrobacteraceae bacterium CFH 75059]